MSSALIKLCAEPGRDAPPALCLSSTACDGTGCGGGGVGMTAARQRSERMISPPLGISYFFHVGREQRLVGILERLMQVGLPRRTFCFSSGGPRTLLSLVPIP